MRGENLCFFLRMYKRATADVVFRRARSMFEQILQLIKCSVLFCQIVNVIFGVKLTTAVFKKLAGFIEASKAVDMVVEPLGDPVKAIGGDYILQLPKLLLHGVFHLCAVGTAQSIGGEVTNGATGPVAVLQAAPGVIRYFNPQVFPVQPVPCTGYVPDGKGSGNQLLFHFITNHHMEAVAKLINLPMMYI